MKFLILFFAVLALVAAKESAKDKRDIIITRADVPYAYAAAPAVAYAAPAVAYPYSAYPYSSYSRVIYY